ncbi:dnaj dnaj protein, partial [Nannochloropsis gaditana CCMP526]|uniref:dnaj dnaj protein n=1 Tax=Nannochloropsis gaditana (strain CCMP526) TaxID=1093141 RepID=UPI00029F6931
MMEQDHAHAEQREEKSAVEASSNALSSASERTTSNPKTPSSFLSYAPRDASEGLAEGLKSIALGVGAGVAGLVAMPVVGAREKGVSGFFKGLGQGVLGAVVLPTVGVVNGVVEIGAGIVNTPESVNARMEGRSWDEKQRKWIRYDLKEEATRVFQEEKEEE